MKTLLLLTAALEAATGVALLAAPARIVALLLGVQLDAPGTPAIARLAGSALLALGVACWCARQDVRSRAAFGVVAAMLVYNLAVIAVLVGWRCDSGTSGIGLWPAVVLHALFAAWCARCLRG